MSDYEKLGYDSGKHWAEGLNDDLDDDEAAQLDRAAGFQIPDGIFQWDEPWSGLDWFAFHVLGVDPNEEIAAAEMAEDFWSGIYRASGVDEDFDADAFLRGFVSGVRDAAAAAD